MTLTGVRFGAGFCTQGLAKFSILRTPVHLSGGWASRQRRSPTGGLANGMPLNVRTPDFSVTPEI